MISSSACLKSRSAPSGTRPRLQGPRLQLCLPAATRRACNSPLLLPGMWQLACDLLHQCCHWQSDKGMRMAAKAGRTPCAPLSAWGQPTDSQSLQEAEDMSPASAASHAKMLSWMDTSLSAGPDAQLLPLLR